MYETPNQTDSLGLRPTSLGSTNLEKSLEKADDTAQVSTKSVNDTKLVTDLMGQTSMMAAQSSLMASYMIKSTEKDEVGTVKLIKSTSKEGDSYTFEQVYS